MTPLTIQVEETSGWHVVKLSGSLIEGAEALLAPLGKIVGATCAFDFEHLTSINSSGIAEWLAFREGFDVGRSIVLQRCPIAVIDVINLMPRFRGTATVRTLFMPYVCADCSKEMLAHVEIKPGFDPESLKNVKNPCPKCKGTLEPQVEPSEYLAFLG